MLNKIKDIFTKEKVKNFFKCLIKSPLFYITLFAIIADIVSKWAVQLNLFVGQEVTIIPNFLFVTLAHNTGGMFSFGANSEGARIALIVVRSLLAVIIPIAYLYKKKELKMRYRVCILLIYAGCIGNLIDGLFYYENIVGFRGVIDWIQFSFFDATFNIADSYVTVCVFLIIIFIIIDEIKEVLERNRKGEYSMTPEEYQKKLDEEKKNENKNK